MGTSDQPVPAEAGGGKYISLATDLKPEPVVVKEETTQSKLLERWTKTQAVAQNKVFRLGSQETVEAGIDKGLFSVIMAAYNNHWILRTRPEDWWTTISQIIATRIDKVANYNNVRRFFVSHEGKKTLTVNVGSSITGIEKESFFQQMISEISKNINNPDYTTLMESDFSQSTSVDRIVNNIMLMFSFQKYFEYRASTRCGIPGVIMEGSEEDWRRLLQKFEEVEEYLKPIDSALDLEYWFEEVKPVLQKLIDTFCGNPDKDWWSRIFDQYTRHGSGAGTFYSGWFVTTFLGIEGKGELDDVPSGVNVVPLTLEAPGHLEEAALAAGFTGYKVRQEEVTENNQTFPSVQAVTGWALLMDPNSPLF